LAAIDPGPPYAAGGTALALAGMGQSGEPEDMIDGMGFVAYYGAIAARVGRQTQAAGDEQSNAAVGAAQARSLRDQLSGVSLDEEAVYLIQFQRSYQAIAKMIAVLDTLADSTLQLLGS
jgi:flagellar hook-associated protein 1 FlgK